MTDEQKTASIAELKKLLQEFQDISMRYWEDHIRERIVQLQEEGNDD